MFYFKKILIILLIHLGINSAKYRFYVNFENRSWDCIYKERLFVGVCALFFCIRIISHPITRKFSVHMFTLTWL